MFKRFLSYLREDDNDLPKVKSLKEAIIMAKEISTSKKESDLLAKATNIYNKENLLAFNDKTDEFEGKVRQKMLQAKESSVSLK